MCTQNDSNGNVVVSACVWSDSDRIGLSGASFVRRSVSAKNFNVCMLDSDRIWGNQNEFIIDIRFIRRLCVCLPIGGGLLCARSADNDSDDCGNGRSCTNEGMAQ